MANSSYSCPRRMMKKSFLRQIVTNLADASLQAGGVSLPLMKIDCAGYNVLQAPLHGDLVAASANRKL